MKDDDSRRRKRPRCASSDAGPDGAGPGPVRFREQMRHVRELPREEGSKLPGEPGRTRDQEEEGRQAVAGPAEEAGAPDAFLPAQRGYESDESSTLGWVVDVPAWDADEAARLKEKDALLDEFANDFYQRVYDPSKAASLDVCAEHARPRRADDDACACALNKDADPVKAGGLCKEALDALVGRGVRDSFDARSRRSASTRGPRRESRRRRGGLASRRGAPQNTDARRSRRWRAMRSTRRGRGRRRREGARAPSEAMDRTPKSSREGTEQNRQKRRNGCNGPGALELRWALGARGALAPKDRERAAALLDDNEGRGLDACPAVAKGLSRPLGDVLAWYYAAREPDDKEGEKDAWLGGRRKAGRRRSSAGSSQFKSVAQRRRCQR